ncbi:MAG: tRNA preQ1(34) S-adenosylmethionine ribosyltransferase-isomerase QueA [Pseudomonadota bacterium]
MTQTTPDTVFLRSSYEYHLPEELVAQEPAALRDGSRMMVVPRGGGPADHRRFAELPDLLCGDEVLVLNDTRVIPARIFGHKDTGGRVEVFGLGPWTGAETVAMVRSSKVPRIGQGIRLGDGERAVGAEVVEALGEGRYRLRLQGESGLKALPQGEGEATWLEVFETLGDMPLPPYIRRERTKDADRERYQTVFADRAGAVAAPTAGLHFTPEILDALRDRGVEIARLTLHVGLGTFLPVRTDDIRDHRMHTETWQLPAATAAAVNAARGAGRPVLAVGTTVVRTLEAAAGPDGRLAAGEGETDIFIYPGSPLRVVDQLLTNFHLPGSTLIMLVAALCGRERLLGAYEEAVRERYRFYSYGDCMLIR